MKEEKALVIDTIREWVNSSPYLIVLDYTGMKVSEFSELRGRLRKVGGGQGSEEHPFQTRDR